MHRLRVGIVDYLNSRPLAHGLLTGYRSDLFAPSCHSPARVADLLAAGELDVGLLPSIELQRIPGLGVLPGPCVAATREVRSVLLVSSRPAARLRRVALDDNSRTSAALVRILFADRFGIDPEYVQSPPRLDAMMAMADAALLIGDPALRVERSGLGEGDQVWDLAAEWRGLTGLPFVFAVWAVRDDVEMPELAHHFQRSLEAGLAELGTIEEEAVHALSLPRGVVHRYLTYNLRYEMGEEEAAGLEEFFRRAHRHHLISAHRPVTLRSAATPLP